jgi:endonuclease/exonuclease/phosphatase family metal-dependent hydrolase
MRRIFLILGLTVWLLSGCKKENNNPPVTPPDPGRFEVKVLTFNIYNGGATLKNDYDMDRIAAVIEKEDPDLVALQEVDFRTNRSGLKDVATELGLRTNLVPLFGLSYPYDGGGYGTAILSRHTLLRSKVIPLSSGEGKGSSALITTMTVSSTDTITLVSVQFSEEEAIRNAEIARLNKALADIHRPMILAGDLNALPTSSSLDLLQKYWTPVYEEGKIRPTYPSSDPRQKLDYIMFRPADKWSALFRMTIPDKEVSDHCAYFAILGLK